MARSFDQGNTFTSTIVASSVFTGTSRMAVSGNTVVMAWNDASSGNYDVSVSRSSDHGGTFSGRVNVSSNPGQSNGERISISGNTVLVSWIDYTAGNQELVSRSTDGGATFSAPVNVSGTSGSFDPQMVSAGDTALIVWQGHASVPGFGNRVLVTRSTDGGTTFSEPTQLSQDGSVPGFGQLSASVPQMAW